MPFLWQCYILLLPLFTRSVAVVAKNLAFCFCSPLHKTVEKAFTIHQLKEGDNKDNDSTFGLYVHIPYCRRRCNYCDFAITPVGANHHGHDEMKAGGFRKLDAAYKNAVLNEIDVINKSSGHPWEIRPLRSIYFGGGTPSLAPLSTLQAIMDMITKSEDSIFSLTEDAEITIEMDPGTFDLPYLKAVKEMGFNRISLGVQSFDDNLLALMGRVHRSVDVLQSVEMIRQAYGDHANYSIDLISGVPGLSLAGWADTLYRAVSLRPRPMHLSLYDLQLEKGTSFGKWYKNSEDMYDSIKSSARPTLPSAEDCAFMYSYASGYLKSKNYDHYEISSYAYTTAGDGKSHRSKHNQIYWEYGGQWYAVGMGSTSNINGVRFARPRALSDYILWTDGLTAAPRDAPNKKLPPWTSTDNNGTSEDLNEALLDVIMTRLRTSEGLDLDWVAKHDNYGEAHVNAILRGFQLALDLGLGRQSDFRSGTYGFIKLSDPKGFLFSNNIISNIFVSLSEL